MGTCINAAFSPTILHHVGSLSTLIGYGDKRREWSVADKIEKIKRAGFDAFAGRVPMVTAEHVAQSGLIFVTTTDMGGIGVNKSKLKAIKATGSRCVNAQTLNHDTTTQRALEVVRRLMDTADELGMDVSVEMHRDTCTETPEKMYALARRTSAWKNGRSRSRGTFLIPPWSNTSARRIGIGWRNGRT